MLKELKQKLLYKQFSNKEQEEYNDFAKEMQDLGKDEKGELEKTDYHCHICSNKHSQIYFKCSKCERDMCSQHIRVNRFTDKYICSHCLGIPI